MTILLDAEFRELVIHAIPHVVLLLRHKELNFRTAGVDALSKLSEQGNKYIMFSDLIIVDILFIAFRESIRTAIPQIIILLTPWASDVCEAGANALAKLSGQGKLLKFQT